MYNRKEISKTVKVSDPWMWYNQKTVKVCLFINPEYNGSTDVRIFVESIDDFAMEYTRTCFGQADVEATYNQLKRDMFDKMPRKINCKWLREHGFFSF